MTQELQLHWLVHTVTAKLAQSERIIPENNDYINVSAGYLYKKSSFLGEWEKCFVMITQDGLTVSAGEKS
jgi:hypothetical protein